MTNRPLSFTGDRLLVPHGVVTRAVDGSTVLLNTVTGRYFTLDDVGSRAWTVLTSSASIQAAYDTLLSEYQVEPGQLRLDLETLIESLGVQGLAEIRPA